MRVYGNLTNRIMEHSAGKPEVGLGCTICMYSDRHAATVVEVSKSGRQIVVQRDKATRTDGNGMSDSQSYTYERDPNGAKTRFSLRKNGAWREVKGGDGLRLGTRDEHYDFSF